MALPSARPGGLPLTHSLSLSQSVCIAEHDWAQHRGVVLLDTAIASCTAHTTLAEWAVADAARPYILSSLPSYLSLSLSLSLSLCLAPFQGPRDTPMPCLDPPTVRSSRAHQSGAAAHREYRSTLLGMPMSSPSMRLTVTKEPWHARVVADKLHLRCSQCSLPAGEWASSVQYTHVARQGCAAGSRHWAASTCVCLQRGLRAATLPLSPLFSFGVFGCNRKCNGCSTHLFRVTYRVPSGVIWATSPIIIIVAHTDSRLACVVQQRPVESTPSVAICSRGKRTC